MYNEKEMLEKVGVQTLEQLYQIGHWNGECWTVDVLKVLNGIAFIKKGMTITPQHRQRGEDDFELIGYEVKV